MKARPWCACGKVRLGVKQEPVVLETAKRLEVHQFGKCWHVRVPK